MGGRYIADDIRGRRNRDLNRDLSPRVHNLGLEEMTILRSHLVRKLEPIPARQTNKSASPQTIPTLHPGMRGGDFLGVRRGGLRGEGRGGEGEFLAKHFFAVGCDEDCAFEVGEGWELA